ncbi:MAG TPA: invasion associated locus B family protein [Rhizomicrobium sp.]|jgi:invasion protein IalB|nr:invasion associated locus B family protein [Rhizomicrobium sp.]
MTFMRSTLAAVAALLLSFGTAAAQPQPAAAPGSAPLQPSETKSFGDWTVRCYPIASPSPCDMYELLANKQNNQRVMSLSIAYLPAGDKHVIQVAVPLGILIPKGLVIESDTYTSPTLRYRRCDRGGCYVEMLFDTAAVNALATASGPAKIKIVADNGKVFEIPFSLKGYADAHGAMVDLARKKTAEKPPPATPPAAPAATP